MLIDGQRWLGRGDYFEVLNPADGSHLTFVASADERDVDRAVSVARQTFDRGDWLRIPPAGRAQILFRAADLIDSAADELARTETLNNGMPLRQARGMVGRAAEAFRYFGGWVTKIHGLTSNVVRDGREYHGSTLREPYGVAALVVPWNGPILFACNKSAAALAAGCSAVLKPAEETPLSALRLGEILLDAGVPPGVLNVLTGPGESTGAALVKHPGVDKISFTGSAETGRSILRAAAENFAKVTLELGGKSPVIVCDDADVDAAIEGVVNGIFGNSGQVCFAGSRLYVHRSIRDEVVDRVAKIGASLKVGDGLKPDTQMGPLISRRQLDRVAHLVDNALAEGVECVSGGHRRRTPGFFYEPTVLADPPRSAEIQREEIFGPVITVTAFDDLDEASVLANDTRYGLAASVWTRDISTAQRLIRKLQCGNVWINCQKVLDNSMPFGGFKHSGLGREGGDEGIGEYLQTKSVYVPL